ncbi:hypothetical protein U9M48_017900 [Paspalum notatum var. saurae]|uniref:Uncharacterized protein n=1 Tax=Paspalum notatum var. saurae TaxID=547442 RepID=A0AAQ3TAE1_PASNO
MRGGLLRHSAAAARSGTAQRWPGSGAAHRLLPPPRAVSASAPPLGLPRAPSSSSGLLGHGMAGSGSGGTDQGEKGRGNARLGGDSEEADGRGQEPRRRLTGEDRVGRVKPLLPALQDFGWRWKLTLETNFETYQV